VEAGLVEVVVGFGGGFMPGLVSRAAVVSFDAEEGGTFDAEGGGRIEARLLG